MIQLTFKNEKFGPSYDFKLYKNIVGSNKETQDDNFSAFIQGLCDDNPDTIVEFGVAFSGKSLDDISVANQFGEQGLFDNIAKTSNEIISGMLSNGFLAAKIKMYLNSESVSIKRMKEALDAGILKDSDKQQMEVSIQMTEESHNQHEARLDKKAIK